MTRAPALLRLRTTALPVARLGDRSYRVKPPELGLVESEVASQHLGGVGTDLGPPGFERRRAGAGEARKRIVDHDLAEIGVPQRHQRAARRDLRVVEDRVD